MRKILLLASLLLVLSIGITYSASDYYRNSKVASSSTLLAESFPNSLREQAGLEGDECFVLTKKGDTKCQTYQLGS